MTKNSPVLVTGMHRGGTSATARVLSCLGLDTGPKEKLIGAAESNRHGHFEVESITSLNEELLRQIGSSWLSPPEDSHLVTELVGTSYLGKAVHAIDSQFGENPWFVKDPRFSLLLPFWSEVLEARPVVIAVVRSPKAVAQSLNKRDGIPLVYGERLTGTYLNTLHKDIEELPNLVLHYDEMLKDPRSSVEILFEFLATNEIAISTETEAAISAIDPTDNHYVEGENSEVSPLVKLHGNSLKDFDRLPELSTDEKSLASSLAEKIQITNHYKGVLNSKDEQLDSVAKLLEKAEFDAKKSQVDAKKSQADAENLRIEVGDLTLEKDRALAEVEAIRAFRMAEVASTTYQLAALMTRNGAKLFPVDTRRRAFVSFFLRVGRRLYSFLRNARKVSEKKIENISFPELRDGQLPPPVAFETRQEPEVSIVIPVHNQLAFTAQCLESIAKSRNNVSFEVIVVDDKSSDLTSKYLRTCSGVRQVNNSENLGYLRSTNRGAELASAPFIVLLNNDTTVSDGWLDELIATFNRYPDTGIVGASLIYPDGRLQEAGGIIFTDGTGWNYGRLQDPEDEIFSFVREVDYCSAACIAVRKKMWEQIGGFDERFAPAYYEDTDLAFMARSLGWEVRYQPKVQIVHYEGVSHGTEESSGLKAYQKVNHEKFVEKWALELKKQYSKGLENVLRASTRRSRGRIFVADYEVPQWDRHSGALRMSRILNILVELGWNVTFVPGNNDLTEPYTSELQQQGIEVARISGSIQEYLLSKGKNSFDLALLSRPEDGSRWLSAFRTYLPETPIIYDTVDLHVVRMQRGRSLGRSNLSLEEEERITSLESELIKAADLTFVVSETEKDWLAKEIPNAPVHVIGNVHSEDLSKTAFEDRDGLLFVGSWAHPPNQDAIEFLVNEVMPLLWESNPNLILNLAGSGIPMQFGAKENRVICHGWVEDLAPLYNKVLVSVAPLRYGAGLKGKVGESMCRGVPVVGTKVAFEGYEIGQHAEIIQSDTPEGLAKAISEISTQKEIWEKLRQSGRKLVVEKLGVQQISQNLESALTSIDGSLRK